MRDTKSFELLIFKCALQHSEIDAIQKSLPADEYCIVSVPEQKISYGVMNEDLHSRFMDVLSGETLEHLEYLDEKEFKKVVDVKRSKVIGNVGLLDKL